MEEVTTRAETAGLLAAIRRGKTFRALHNRDYRLLWIGQIGHSASLWMETIARSWLIWQLTGSATLLAIVNLLRALPLLIFGLLAGATADRFNKRWILIICQTVTLINYVILALLITTGTVRVWHILLTSFLMGTSMSFNQPTRTSLVPSLVKENELTNAIALNSAALNITRIIGPSVAGLLIAPLGIGGVYIVSTGVYVATLICTIIMQVPPVTVKLISTSLWSDMGEGLRFIWNKKVVFIQIVLAIVPMVFGMPYMTLMPIFADLVLGIGAPGLGLLYSALGTGALLAVMVIATMGRVPRKGLLILLAVFGFGVFLVVFSQSTWVPLSLVSIAFTGFTVTSFMVLVNTSLLETTPPELRGRVMAVYTLDRGLMPLGTMIMGPLADAIGAPPTVLIMGGICMLLSLFIGIGISLVRRIP
ncbi:MFS transporter [Chloroflexota bacterium]